MKVYACYNKNEDVRLKSSSGVCFLYWQRRYCLRLSCYKCLAKDVKMLDLTIADFWGIRNVAPEMNDDKGTSLAIIRTFKGEKLFQKISDEMKVKEVSYEDAVKGNPAEYCSVKRPTERDSFL